MINTITGVWHRRAVRVIGGQSVWADRPEESAAQRYAVLGGSFEPQNIEVSDLIVTLSSTGQIHQQIKDLPPGTAITGIQIH